MKRVIPIILCCSFLAGSALAYDRAVANNYASQWWNTSPDGDEFVEHFNSPTYKVYYSPYAVKGSSNVADTRDCANFVSQCLIAGGFNSPMPVTKSGYQGQGGTIAKASDLGTFLENFTVPATVSKKSQNIPRYDYKLLPSELEQGDVVIFNSSHAVFVSTGTAENVLFAAHSSDHYRNDEKRNLPVTLDYFFKSRYFTCAKIYHIEPFIITIDPLVKNISQGATSTHQVAVCNKTMPSNADFTLHVSTEGIGWDTDLISSLDNLTFRLEQGTTEYFTFSVTNKSGTGDFEANVTATVSNFVKYASAYNISSEEHLKDHPDDNYSVSDANYPYPWLVDTKSDVGILLSGWGEGAGHLLGKYGIRTAAVTSDLRIVGEPKRTLTDLKVLVIGSAGLSGISSQIIKRKLEEFVSNGGVIVCLTQPKGSDFSVLPGGIGGYGWDEDQSCFSAAVYINSLSPALASQSETAVDASVDGYFTTYPLNSKILLRRTKNAMPALVEYPVGSGRVIVGTLYSDWGYGHQQASEQECKLIRDMVLYAKTTGEQIAEYVVGGSANERLTVQLPYDENGEPLAKTIALTATAADGAVTTFPEQEINSADETASFDLAAPISWPGLYSIGYVMKDSEGVIVDSINESKHFFAKENPLTGGYSPDDFQLWAAAPSEKIIANDVVTYTVNIKNNTDKDLLDAVVAVGGHEQGGRFWAFYDAISSVTVPAHSTGEVKYRRPIPLSTSVYFGLYEKGENYQQDFFPDAHAICEKGVWTTETPLVDAKVTAGQKEYRLGDSARFDILLKNREAISADTAVRITLVDPGYKEILRKDQNVLLGPGGSASVSCEYAIPIDATIGTYMAYVQVVNINNGKTIGGGSGGFQVPAAHVSVEALCPQIFQSGGNAVSFVLRNKEKVPLSSGTARVELLEPDGKIAWSTSCDLEALVSGSSTTIPMNIVVDPLKLGTYKLNYSFINTNGCIELPCSVANELVLDKQEYRVRDQVILEQRIVNNGRFSITHATAMITIPDLAFSCVKDITLLPGESTGTITNATLPESIPPGQHTITSTVNLITVSSKTYTFTVADKNVSFELNKNSYSENESGIARVVNSGGVDLQLEYRLQIQGNSSVIVYEKTGATSLMPPGSNTDISFDIPGNLQSGIYSFLLTLKEPGSGNDFSLVRYAEIKGATSVQVAADKLVYQANENINIGANVTATGRIDNASLDLKVFSSGAGWTSYTYKLPGSRAIARDENYIWVGTSYGAARLDKKTEKWRFFTAADGLESNGVGAIAIDGNCVWFGTSYGLSRYDMATGQWMTVDDINTRVARHTSAMAIDGDYIWLASDSGVGRYNKKTNTFDCINQSVSVRGVAIAYDGTYAWSCLQSGGVTRCNGRYGWSRFDGSSELLSCGIYSIMVDGNTIWFGSGSDGAILYDKAAGTFRKFTTADGMISNTINGFAADGDNIWMATNRGVSRYNKTTNTFVNYTTNDGLLDNYVNSVIVDGNNVWFATYSGVSRYDRTIEWRSYFNQLSFSNAFAICADSSCVWVGGDMPNSSLNQYGKSNDSWRMFKTENGVPPGTIRTLIADNDTLWIGTYGSGIGRYNRSANTWVTYSSAAYVDSKNVRAIALDGNYVWFGTENGASRYSKVDDTWRKYSKADGLLENCVVDMAVDGSDVWFVTPKGASRYDRLSNKWTTYSNYQIINGLSYVTVNAVAVSGNYVWFGTSSGASRYDKTTGTWSLFTFEDLLTDNPVNDIVVAAGYVWFATNNNGVVRYDPSLNQWKHFTNAEGLSNNKVYCAAPDGAYMWFGTASGVSRLQMRRSIWEKNVTVSGAGIFSASNDSLSISEGGKFYFEGSLTSSFGQKLAEATTSFYVAPGGFSVTFATDKKIYKVGENIVVSGEMRNDGPVACDNVPVVLERNGNSIYSTSVSLQPGEVKSFTVNTPADHSFTLKCTAKDVEMYDSVEVESPQIDIVVAGLEVADIDPFDLSILLKNNGNIDSTVTLGIAGDTYPVTLKSGESRLLMKTVSITGDTTFDVTLTGDVTKTVSKTVRLGVGANLVVSPAVVYPEGTAEIPFSVTNSGALAMNAEISFTINGTTITKRYSIPGEGGTFDNLLLENMTQGDYVLSYASTPNLVSGTALVRVAKMNVVDIRELVTEMDMSLPENPRLRITARVKNSGANAFVGMFKLDTGFFSETRDLNLSLDEERELVFEMPAKAAAGRYEVREQVYCNGDVIAVKNESLDLLPCFFVIEASVNSPVQLGETATMSFRVMNQGNAEGMVKLHAGIGAMLDEERSAWLSYGEIKDFSFTFTAPDDLEEKDYNCTLSVENTQTGEKTQQVFPVQIAGYKVSVIPVLDKALYLSTETAKLTLSIDTLNQLSPRVYVKVTCSGYQKTTGLFEVTQSSTQTREFEFPVSFNNGNGDMLVSYGVYLESGRALYLNTVYVYQKQPGVGLTMRKQCYDDSEYNIYLTVTADQKGKLEIWGEEFQSRSYTLRVGDTFESVLRREMTRVNSGTCYINYSFTAEGSTVPVQGRFRYDVNGLMVLVKDCVPDRAQYRSGDTMKLVFAIDSNSGANDVHLKGWVKGKDDYEAVFDIYDIAINEGLQTFPVSATLPSLPEGTNEVVYGIYKNRYDESEATLANGRVSFDVIADTSAVAPQVRISSPVANAVVSDTATISVTASGGGNISRYQLMVDGQQYSELVTSQTAVSLSWDTRTLGDGSHSLKAIAFNDKGNSGEASVTVTVDNAAPVVQILSPKGEEKYTSLTSSITVSYVVTDALDPAPTSYALLTDLARGTTMQVSNGQVVSPLTLGGGSWRMTVQAVDWAGNSASSSTLAFEVQCDTMPPVSSLATDGHSYADSGKIWISTTTGLVIQAVDDLLVVGDKAGSGVRTSYVAVDNETAFTLYAGTFTIAEGGQHTISCYSIDMAGSTETVKRYSVIVDTIAPVSVVSAGGSSVLREGKLYLNAGSGIVLSAADGGVLASGLRETEYRIDGEAWRVYTGTVSVASLDNSEHTFSCRSTDRVGNREGEQIYAIMVDTVVPQTECRLSGPCIDSGGDACISGRTDVVLTAIDTGTVLSGIAGTVCEVRVGTSPVVAARYDFSASTCSPTMISTANITGADGSYTLSWYSTDAAGNREQASSRRILLDNSAPKSGFLVQGPQFRGDQGLFVSSSSLLTITADDPAVNGVAAGIDGSYYKVDAATESIRYNGPFGGLSEGAHTITFHSVDRLGNREGPASVIVKLDTTAPNSACTVAGSRFSLGQVSCLGPDAVVTLNAIDSSACNAASGVNRIEYRVVASSVSAEAFRVYAGSFTLPSEGTFLVEYRAIDNAGNCEQLRTAKLTSSRLSVYAVAGFNGISITGSASITGKVVSNGTALLSGKVAVKGDVYAHKITLKGRSTITGAKVENAAPVCAEPFDLGAVIESACRVNDNSLIPRTSNGRRALNDQGELILLGCESLTLSTGTYHFNGITIAGKGALKTSGAVTIVCTGDINLLGKAAFNAQNDPQKFVVLVGSCTRNGGISASGTAVTLSDIFDSYEMKELTTLINAASGAIAVDASGTMRCNPQGGNVPRLVIGGQAELNAIVYAPDSKLCCAGWLASRGSLYARDIDISGSVSVEPYSSGITIASGKSPLAAPGAFGEFKFESALSYPNPAKGGVKPTIRIACGSADRVDLRIFTVAGELVHHASIAGSDLRLVNGTIAYEYQWDVHDIASGVYIGIIEAHRGGDTIRATRKIAIEK